MKALMLGLAIFLQTPVTKEAIKPIVASPSQQEQIKPLVEAEKKAREAWEKAAAPEKRALDKASAAALDLAYKIMAENKLSSREYMPLLDPKTGELIFQKIAPEK